MAVKHQFMMSYHFESSTVQKPSFTVSASSKVPVDILHPDVQKAVKLKYPGTSHVQLTTNALANGLNYKIGMIVVHGSAAGLPEFAEVVQMAIVHCRLNFIVKEFSAWYWEHFRAFQLCSTSNMSLIPLDDLVDQYPLADYRVGGRRMVTLKRYIHLKG